MEESVEDLVDLISRPNQSTSPNSRYKRVMGLMRGVIAASGGSEDQIDNALERAMKGRGEMEGKYQSVCTLIRMGYTLMRESRSEAEVFEALEWPIRNAYLGYLREWN